MGSVVVEVNTRLAVGTVVVAYFPACCVGVSDDRSGCSG